MALSREFVLSTVSNPTSLGYATPLTDEQSEPLYLGLSVSTWGKIAIVSGLFGALFWPNLRRLWQKTNPISGETNWGHSFFIPIIGLYYLYIHREELLKANPRQFLWGRFLRPSRVWVGGAMVALALVTIVIASLVHNPEYLTARDIVVSATDAIGILGLLVLMMDWSLAVMLFGIGLFVYGIYPGQNDYLKDCGMIVTLYGIVLMMCGPEVMKIAWFPVVYLICAIPWPGLVYSWVAGPLQVLAANAAVEVLKITHVSAEVIGTKILIPGKGLEPPRMLNVAEACAGMRALMTFISLGGAMAFLSARPLWQKVIVTFSAIPIAIFCNVMRVSSQGLLDHYVSEKLSESVAHQLVGMVMLVPAFFLLLLMGYLLDQVFIEEVEATHHAGRGAAPGLGSSQTEPAVAKIAAIPARATAIPSITAPAMPSRHAPAVNNRAVIPPRVTPPRPRTAASQPRGPMHPGGIRPPSTGIVPPRIPPRPSANGSATPVKARPIVPPTKPQTGGPGSTQEAT